MGKKFHFFEQRSEIELPLTSHFCSKPKRNVQFISHGDLWATEHYWRWQQSEF